MVNQSWSTGDLELKPLLLKPQKTKAKKDKNGHNFFRQAAALANHKWDEELINQPQTATEELISEHLDESFQDRLELFTHKPPEEELAELSSHRLNEALKIKRKAPEIALESALSFHKKIHELASEESPWPLMIYENDAWFVADHVRQFCSLRLKKKSMQIKAGADPRVRYFHVAIRNSKLAKKCVDLLYWIQFNEDQTAVDGKFIFEPKTVLISPAQFMAHFELTDKVAPVNCMLQKALKRIL